MRKERDSLGSIRAVGGARILPTLSLWSKKRVTNTPLSPFLGVLREKGHSHQERGWFLWVGVGGGGGGVFGGGCFGGGFVGGGGGGLGGGGWKNRRGDTTYSGDGPSYVLRKGKTAGANWDGGSFFKTRTSRGERGGRTATIPLGGGRMLNWSVHFVSGTYKEEGTPGHRN